MPPRSQQWAQLKAPAAPESRIGLGYLPPPSLLGLPKHVSLNRCHKGFHSSKRKKKEGQRINLLELYKLYAADLLVAYCTTESSLSNAAGTQREAERVLEKGYGCVHS